MHARKIERFNFGILEYVVEINEECSYMPSFDIGSESLNNTHERFDSCYVRIQSWKENEHNVYGNLTLYCIDLNLFVQWYSNTRVNKTF